MYSNKVSTVLPLSSTDVSNHGSSSSHNFDQQPIRPSVVNLDLPKLPEVSNTVSTKYLLAPETIKLIILGVSVAVVTGVVTAIAVTQTPKSSGKTLAVTSDNRIIPTSVSVDSTEVNSATVVSTWQSTTANYNTASSTNTIINAMVTTAVSTNTVISTMVTTTVSTTTINVPSNILNNICTASLKNPQTLLYISNSPVFNYEFVQLSFIASSSNTTLLFALRQDPSYWCLDDISVKSLNGQESIQDGSFESNSLTTHYTFCNPSNSTSSGEISTSCPHTGSYSYYDGAVGNPDYLSQSFATIVGTTYNLTFWLQNRGSPINSATVLVGS